MKQNEMKEPMKTRRNQTWMRLRLVRCMSVLLGVVALMTTWDRVRAEGIVPPEDKFRGLTYGEWAAQWWRTALSIPVVGGSHPNINGGAFDGTKGVLFLAGAGAGATFNITVPAGTPIFFPVVNAECSVLEPDPFHGDN